jgi:hypothetical protein
MSLFSAMKHTYTHLENSILSFCKKSTPKTNTSSSTGTGMSISYSSKVNNEMTFLRSRVIEGKCVHVCWKVFWLLKISN